MSRVCAPRLIRTGFWCLLFAVILIALPLFAQAPPSADTFVSSATPKLNYGPSIILAVGPGTNSYVQFNLSGIPAGASISKASLRLYVDAVSGSGTLDVFQVTSSWTENKVTYNTRPTQQSVSAMVGSSVPITSANCNQFLLIDITPLAQGWLNGTIPNNGVVLALTSGSGIFSLDSKESLLTGNGPELEIALSGSAGPQGPIGPTGLAGPQGLQGTAGPAGAAGAAGPKGDPGAVGPTGPAGPQGAQGSQGTTGPQGPIGLTGAQGATGLIGPAGPQGLMGPQGPPGVPPPNVALTTAPNTFAGDQTINGNLILSGTGGIRFPDGTVLTSASQVISQPPAGSLLSSTLPDVPPGYRLLNVSTIGGGWNQGGNMPVSTSCMTATALLNGQIWLIGGQPGGLIQINAGGGASWTNSSFTLPSGRCGHATVDIPDEGNQDHLFVIGGLDNTGTFVDTVFGIDPLIGITSSPHLSSARAGLAAAVANNEIFLFGGSDSSGATLDLAEVSSDFGQSWTKIASLPSPRQALGAVTVGGKIYIMGGADSNLVPTNAAYAYDPLADTRAPIQSMPAAKYLFATAVVGGNIYVIGGSDANANALNTVEMYDPIQNKWTELAPMTTARTNFAAAVANGNVVAYGGTQDGVNPLSSYEQLTPPTTIYTFIKN
jgi:N-acetylneuraminic acid mutarotase